MENNSLLDILLDPDNDENVTLYNEDGEPTEFEQLAIIPHSVKGEERLYAILKPVVPPEGFDEMSVLVFRVEEDEDGEVAIIIETDDEIGEAVFAEFERLVEEYAEESNDNED